MITALTAVLGLALGSFANVCIDRVPVGQSLRGRSTCDRCRRNLRWWELVPIVSALALRSRCPTCGGGIAARYTFVELGAAAMLVLVLWRHGGAVTISGAIEAFGLLTLGVLAIIDLRRGVVPDNLSIPAIGFLVVAKIFYFLLFTFYFPKALFSLAASMVLGAGFFAVQRLASRGRWVGDGDIRVGALMGALFAPSHLILALAASYIIGGAIAAALLLTRRIERGSHLPLVPFLFLGSLFSIFLSDEMIAWYGFN